MNAFAPAGVSSRRTCSCMPPVVARPAPVITAARTPGSRRSASNVLRIPSTISGTIRLSGGRSRVTHAHAPSRSTRTKPVIDTACSSVPLHGGIDGARPLVDAALQVDRLEALLAEEVGHRGAAHPVVAVHDDVVGLVQLRGAELDLLERDVGGVGEAAERGLPVLAHVQQHEGLMAIEPRLQLLGADLGHGGSPGAKIACQDSAGSSTEVSGEISILTSSPGLNPLPCWAEVSISTRTAPPGIATS